MATGSLAASRSASMSHSTPQRWGMPSAKANRSQPAHSWLPPARPRGSASEGDAEQAGTDRSRAHPVLATQPPWAADLVWVSAVRTEDLARWPDRMSAIARSATARGPGTSSPARSAPSPDGRDRGDTDRMHAAGIRAVAGPRIGSPAPHDTHEKPELRPRRIDLQGGGARLARERPLSRRRRRNR
jgi:hypothetical protein